MEEFRISIIVIILLNLCCIEVNGQHETDNWYFADGASLQFSNGKIIVSNKSQIGNSEPAASISDCRGNLLFYTDGNKVWNNSQALMINGTDLNGHYSSTQGALIVPWPKHCNLFYVFTLDALEHGFTNGLNYSIVDIDKQNKTG